jgi:Leu/Phe-tRNA-protein transferase
VNAPVTPSLVEPELLMLAYRSGIFPMSDARDDPDLFWVEPRLRAVLPHAATWALHRHLRPGIQPGDGGLRRAARRWRRKLDQPSYPGEL